MNLGNGILGEPNGVGSYLFCGNDPVDFTDPMGLDYVSVEGGNVYWNVEKDSYLYNPDVNRHLVGSVADGTVTFNQTFGGGSASLDVLKKYANRFWDRPVSGSVLDPTDISSMTDDVQRGIVQDYLQNYVRDYGYATISEYRGPFSSKIDRRLDVAQTGLDVAGCADPTFVCDGINAIGYKIRGKNDEAAMSVVAMFPYLGDIVGKGGKLGLRTAKTLSKGDDFVDLYRAVEKAELDEVMTTRRFRFIPKKSSTPDLNLQGKYFYGSLGDLDIGARRILLPGQMEGVLATRVRRDALKHVFPNIDGGVTGYFIEIQDLTQPIIRVR